MTLSEAKAKAKRNNCFIVTFADYFLLYREGFPKNVRIGKRTAEKDIIGLVNKACKLP